MVQRIRVLVVDDQALLRESFRRLLELENDIEVIGTAGTGEEALALIEQNARQQIWPDVILMDIRMPGMNGIETAQQCQQRWPGLHIIMLTTFDDDALLRDAFRAGALGYLLKDTTAEDLFVTIRAGARGQLLLQPSVASKLSSAFFSSTAKHVPSAEHPPDTTLPLVGGERLTERELEILTLLARGASNREISEMLYITHGTVKNHISTILSKLGARDRTQAALKAKELGLG
ncbi:MAG TPA: response regulator transcription factor [Ktedonobacteraceae bacterium]